MAFPLHERRGELGLSLVEALVVVVVSAMLSLLLLPLVSGTGARSYPRAQAVIERLNAAQGERDFRTLLQAAVSTDFQGDALSLATIVAPEQGVLCVRAGEAIGLRLAILNGDEGGGELVCEAEGRRIRVFAWSEGRGGFTYARPGGTWNGAWREPEAQVGGARLAPLVRFDVSDGDSVAWVAQAGWSEEDSAEEVAP
jgi:hypothetical protein